MEDYTKYTLEGACSFFIVVLAYRVYKLKCKTTSNCCEDRFTVDLENDGGEL